MEGGVFYIDTAKSLTLTSSLIIYERNSAKTNGGIFRVATPGTLSMTYTGDTMIKNSADTTGGAVFIPP